MSAIRNNSNRSEARKNRSTPYSRGIIGTISRFFGYLSGSSSEESAESVDEDNSRRANSSQPNGRQIVSSSPKYNFSSGNRVPLTTSNAYNHGSRSALPEPPLPNSEQVASYFTQRMGTNVSTNEVESMITNLQTTPERERFRFTFTTPGRISSPSFSPSNIASTESPSASPSKKLARNPNGVYRWEGGGSAKAARQRNRFASPAFGVSPVKTQKSAEQSNGPIQDSKRRKVGGPSTSSTYTSNGIPFPNMSPSTPRTNGVLRQTSPLPPSRLRTPVKPTAPINPSPLRQAWSDASSTSSHEDNKPSQATRPTKAANLVAELIKETAPPPKPDLSNPYQTASPVGKVGPPRRGTKRPRAVGKPLPTKDQKAEEEKRKAEEQKKKEEEEKLKALSAQAIIEATLPKGSKRSRPPAHLENRQAGDPPRSPSPSRPTSVPVETVTYTVEEAEDTERPKKKSRSSSTEPSQTNPMLADVTVEEIEDVDMDKEKGKDLVKPANGTSQLSRSAQLPSFKTSSIPREPSKLRFSFQAESSSSSSTPTSTPIPLPSLASEDQATPSVSTTVPGPAPPSIQAVSSGFSFSFKGPSTVTPPKEKATESTVHGSTKVDAIKAQVHAIDVKALPSFLFSSTGFSILPGTPEHVHAREAAEAIPLASLSFFAFASTNSFSFGFDPASPMPIAAFPVDESSSAFKPFPAVKASTTPASNIFGTVPSKSFATPSTTSATNIFGIVPSKSSAITTPVKGFDFAAAGMKPPVVAKDTWKCDQCGLSNSLEAQKCTVCDEPRLGFTVPTPPEPPSSTAVVMTAPPVKAFDWASAGLQVPTPGKDTWKCGVCALSNPKSATKCTVCDADAPVSSIASPKPSVSSRNMFLGNL